MAQDTPPLPSGLAKALSARAASEVESWRVGRRVYVRASSPAGPLFARFSLDPTDRETLAHERAVRGIVGSEGGTLRAPPVLEAGPDWLLEVEITPEVARGPSWVDAAALAAAAVAKLVLPNRPPLRASRPVAAVGRRLRWLASPVPLADIVRARRLVAASALPRATSHGDFHARNVLVSGGVAWVVDWELSGRRPAGYDMMRLWAGLADDGDRTRAFEAAVATVGAAARTELLRLRYAVAVQTAVGMLAAKHEFDRDPSGGRALLRLLPDLRAEAGA